MKLFLNRLLRSPRARAEKVLACIEAVRARTGAVVQWWTSLRDSTIEAEQAAYAALDVAAIEAAAQRRALFAAAEHGFMVRHSSLTNMAEIEARKHQAEIVDLLSVADEQLLEKMNAVRAAYQKELVEQGAGGLVGEPPLIAAMEEKRRQLNSYLHAATNAMDLESSIRWLLENTAEA